MEQTQTHEGKANSRNGVKRMIFVIISIVLELLLILMTFSRLYVLAEWINVFARIFALLLALFIYSKAITSTMKMPWVILILTLPIMGITLYLLVGLNRGPRDMRERYSEIDHALLPLLPENKEELADLKTSFPDAAGIASYIANRAGYPVYQDTDVVYYDDASPALEAQLNALREAKSFIFMEYHAIEDASSWQRIEDVLAEKAQEGIDVRVFYDDMGSIGFITTNFVSKLEKRGIQCKVFNPFKLGLNVFLNNRDHRKITVVDGKVGFTGGYNLAEEYFNITNPFGQWKDTGVRLEGDAVRSLTVAFLEMWYAGSKENWDEADFSRFTPATDYHSHRDGFVQPYADSPMDDKRIGEDVYISIAEKANRYCWFITPYLILTDEMIHALSLAAKRGVDVRVITPGIPDKKIVYSVTRSFYNSLARNGVRIFEWSPGFCHCKMSVADDAVATCGTINLDYRSLYHHFENGCLMVGSHVVTEIRQDFERTFEQCTEVTEQYRDIRSGYLKLSQLILRLFAELL
ncbi:MAG: cardiolipin synthase [Oscillospiraceae bacterium]|nr:cardiolipin synthase [Oscillospiraceae bacterium]